MLGTAWLAYSQALSNLSARIKGDFGVIHVYSEGFYSLKKLLVGLRTWTQLVCSSQAVSFN